jgi:hypothetical protein
MSIDLKDVRERYPNTLILRLQGMFYHAYGNSAFVLAAVTGYSVIITRGTLCDKQGVGCEDCGKCTFSCGFPINTLSKVTDLLGERNINYVVFDGDTVAHSLDFNTTNRFLEFLGDGKSVIDVPAKADVKSGMKSEDKKAVLSESEQTMQVSEQMDFIGKNQTEAYLFLQQYVDAELIKGKRVVSMSFYGERQSEHRFNLSGIIIFEKVKEAG